MLASGDQASSSVAQAYAASLLNPEDYGAGSGVPDGFSRGTHRFQTKLVEPVVFDTAGRFAVLVAPNPLSHVFQVAGNGTVSFSLGRWSSDGMSFHAFGRGGGYHYAALGYSLPDASLATGQTTRFPLLPPVLEADQDGMDLFAGPQPGDIPFSAGDTVGIRAAGRNGGGGAVADFNMVSWFRLASGALSPVSATYTFTSTGSEIFGTSTAPANTVALAYIELTGGPSSPIVLFDNVVFYGTTTLAAANRDVLQSLPIPDYDLLPPNGRLRLVSMSVWLQYTGSLTSNGQVASRLMTDEGHPLQTLVHHYEVLGDLPQSYSGKLVDGTYVYWQPTSVEHTAFVDPDATWQYDAPYIAIAGQTNDSAAQNCRVTVIANWEMYHTNQLFGSVPCAYAPNAVTDAVHMLQGIPNAMCNSTHLEKIRRYLKAAAKISDKAIGRYGGLAVLAATAAAGPEAGEGLNEGLRVARQIARAAGTAL